MVRAAVDEGGDLGEARDQVHHVLVRVVPVQGLVGALGVLGREDRLRLHREDGTRELGHRVHALGEGADHVLDVGRQLGARVQLGGEGVGLRLGGHLAGHQKPE